MSDNINIPEKEPSVHGSDRDFVWDSRHENLIERWKNVCERYVVLHNEAGKFFNILHKLVGIPATICIGIAGMIQVDTFVSECDAGSNWVSIISFLLCVLATTMDVIYKYCGLDKRSDTHCKIAASYQNLCYTIDEQMVFDAETRINPRSMLRHVKNVMVEIRKLSPDIPSRVENKYLSRVTFPLQNVIVDPLNSSSSSTPLTATNVANGVIGSTISPIFSQQEEKKNHNPPISSQPTTIKEEDEEEKEEEVENEEDLQDEFARRLEEKMMQKKIMLEKHYLDRMQNS